MKDELYFPEPNTGCWLWLGSDRGNGYGRINVNGKSVAAHRFSFEEATGEKIPEGLVCDHKCRTPQCVNPAHLRVVTPRINSIENSISPAAINAAKTHCVNGHEFTLENTYIRSRNGTDRRVCRICNYDYVKSHFIRKSALNPEETKGGGQ